ncbi:MucR family transcriptional regulator [Mesorhizobium sp. J18]|nr:MucR family transcriptional regulator [Mesorhizobium sp. J18]TWG96702.1 MucR family transcriptional regulator [Mesorhizobium sp. J18]
MDETERTGVLQITARIVKAFAARNRLTTSDLFDLIESVSSTITVLGNPEAKPAAEKRRPAVPIKDSITPEYIISLEDGQKFRSLRRHLMQKHGLTPEQYRIRWNLPADYPMVAPEYAQKRSKIAKKARQEQLKGLSKDS